MALDGKYALITGSSRGIGRGIALALAESGAKVAIHYFQNESAAKETLEEVWTEDSVLNTLPDQVQQLIRDWHNRGWTPMGRLGTPADIGDVVVLLCSEKARWITGR